MHEEPWARFKLIARSTGVGITVSDASAGTDGNVYRLGLIADQERDALNAALYTSADALRIRAILLHPILPEGTKSYGNNSAVRVIGNWAAPETS